MAPSAVETVKKSVGDVLTSKLTTQTVDPVQVALDEAIARFVARNPSSHELHKQATHSMPGGNTRTQLHTFPFPVCMKFGEGYKVTSEDGQTYVILPFSSYSIRLIIMQIYRFCWRVNGRFIWALSSCY